MFDFIPGTLSSEPFHYFYMGLTTGALLSTRKIRRLLWSYVDRRANIEGADQSTSKAELAEQRGGE